MSFLKKDKLLPNCAKGIIAVLFYFLVSTLFHPSVFAHEHKYNGYFIANNNPSDTAKSRITGRVTSAEDGAGLAGASITILHKRGGSRTTNNGEFSIEVSQGDTLVVSYVGKKTEYVAFTGQKSLDIKLSNSNEAAPEVVVTGYQRVDKTKFTGSTAKVKMNEIKQEGVMDVSRMLEGRVAGVSVENVSGTFGAAPKLRIRGATSITGANKPLWVVDGVKLEDIVDVTNEQLASGDVTTIFGSSVAGININDIEDIQFLKDAYSTAMYGTRAMNGVMVITTKKGVANSRAQITYSGTFSSVLRPTYNRLNIMNSAEQMSVYEEMGGNFALLEGKGWMNFSDVSRSATGGVFTKAADLISTWDPVNQRFGLANNPDSISAFLRRYAVANTDWFKVLFRNSFTQEHNISMSFGTDKAQSYASVNFYQDKGRSIGDHVNRYIANVKNTYTPNNKLTITINPTISIRQQETPGTIDRQSNNVTGGYNRDFDINPYAYAMSTSRIITAYDENGNLEYFRKNFAPFNIINELNNNTLKANMMDAKLQGELGYKILPELKYEFIGAIRFVQSSLEHEVTENSNMAQAYRANNNSYVNEMNPFLYQNPDDPNGQKIVILPKGGFYNRADNKMYTYSARQQLSYNKNFNKISSLSLFAGMEVNGTDRRVSSSNGYGYQYQSGGIPFVDYNAVKRLVEANFNYYGMSDVHDRFVGLFGNASYTYKRRYTLSATVREDASNNVGKGSSRWTPTWTVSGGWDVYAEPFMRNIVEAANISHLRLKGSYGLSANFGSASNSSAILRSLSTSRPTAGEQETGINIISLENSDLTWEKKYESNVGIDLGFFRERLNATVDIYNRRNFDLISMVATAGVGGQVYKPANYADMASHGLDVSVGGKLIANKNFSWSSNFTFSYNITKITNMKTIASIGGLTSQGGGTKLGYPVRSIFSIQFKGLDSLSGVPLFINEAGRVSDDVFLQNSNTSFLKYEGSAEPLYTGGFSHTFTYRNSLSLNLLFVYQAGYKVMMNSVFRSQYSDMNAMSRDFINRWEVPGEEQKTNIPSISDRRVVYYIGNSSPYSIYNMSDARIANGGFVRLKSAVITYAIPERITRAARISSSSLSFSSNNLWLMISDKKLKGQDPEFVNAGGVAMPVSTQFALSLKIGF